MRLEENCSGITHKLVVNVMKLHGRRFLQYHSQTVGQCKVADRKSWQSHLQAVCHAIRLPGQIKNTEMLLTSCWSYMPCDTETAMQRVTATSLTIY